MYITRNTFTMVFLKVDLTKNVLKYLENSFCFLMFLCDELCCEVMSEPQWNWFQELKGIILATWLSWY